MDSIELEDISPNLVNRVMKLKDLWISRSDEIPFYTLGRCAYLDGKTPEYLENSKKNNEVLEVAFMDLYVEVLHKLGTLLNEPVKLERKLAFPGFHIFESHPALTQPIAKWHVDIPHKTLGLEGEEHYTFTVPLELPSSGGGLDIIGKDGEEQYIPYTVNTMTLSDGKTPHRIACFKDYVPGEYRITLQGHIYRRDGDLLAFF
jgi:hypothetical protein